VAEEIDFADAFVMLEHAVAFHKCEDLDIPQAAEMMQFAADVLGLQCPPKLPRICIDDEMAGKVFGNFVISIKIITLKSWTGSARDQGILVHELAHYLQQFNNVPFCEEQAERARHAWLEQIRNAEPRMAAMANVDSTSDARTVNNTMRHAYRVLSDAEKANMQSIKDLGLEFHTFIEGMGNSREISLAKTKIEEAVMWAVKHITA
jgi:hypothetical protein